MQKYINLNKVLFALLFSSQVGLASTQLLSKQALGMGNISPLTSEELKPQVQSNGSYRAENPANGWSILYGLDGATLLEPLIPTDRKYSISLKLDSIATSINGSNQIEFDNPENIIAVETRLTYQWTDNFKEIWINSPNKLEQWFIFEKRPELVEYTGQLVIKMDLSTDLNVSQEYDSLQFSEIITYDKLKVWDKNGLDIPATMSLHKNKLSLIVNDALAVYPLTIDPTFQQRAYLKASNTDAGDLFGTAVSISGDTLVIGAQNEDSASTGIDGEQNDNSVSDAGAAYVYTRESGAWVQRAYLKASDTRIGAKFGASVAIDGDTIVVGSPKRAAAYVFVRSAGEWFQQAYLTASNSGSGDNFGISVAISGDTIVVGARGEDSNATGANADETDNSAVDSGAAYVFIRNQGDWSQQAYLKASNTDEEDAFGSSVSISGNLLIVGSPYESSSSVGVNSDEEDNSSLGSGAAYVFVRDGTSWSQRAYLKASNTGGNPYQLPPGFDSPILPQYSGDNFGTSVAISENLLVVGASKESSDSSGVNGNEADNSRWGTGAAYLFTLENDEWSQSAYLKPSSTWFARAFGEKVAVSDGIVLIGASMELSKATGVDGNSSAASANGAGAAYVFAHRQGFWKQQAYIKASNTDSGDYFGSSVAISEDTIVIGADYEDSNSQGVNGNEDDNNARDSGAVYVFNAIPANQVITGFTSTPFRGVVNGTAKLDAFASSGLAVTYASTTSNICKVAGGIVVFLRQGTCNVTAEQLGNSDFYASPQSSLKIIVADETLIPSLACMDFYVRLSDDLSAINVESTGVDDTSNLQCALDAAVEFQVPTVKLSAAYYYISNLYIKNFNGRLEGKTTDSTTIEILDQSIGCDQMVSVGLTPAAIKFSKGSAQMRYLTVIAGSACSNGSRLQSIVHFTGSAAGDNCENDTIFGSVDRVRIVSNNATGTPVEGVAVYAESEELNACKTPLLGTFKLNRSEIVKVDVGIRTTMRSGAQVDINFNEFSQNKVAAIAIVDSNQITTITGNTISGGSSSATPYSGISIKTLSPDAPNKTRVIINNNDFDISSFSGVESSAVSINQSLPVTDISCVISNNDLIMTGADAWGIVAGEVSNVLVSKNRFAGSAGGAIIVGGSNPVSNWTITSNKGLGSLSSESGYEIWLDENTSRFIIGPGQGATVSDSGVDNTILN